MTFSLRNPDKVAKIVAALNLKILPRDLKSKDTRNLLTLIFGQWLSLSTCTIQAVIDIVPAPSVAQRTRMPKILYPDLLAPTLEPKNKLEKDLFECDAGAGACVVAYVSKMFAVETKDLPERKKKPLTAEEMRERGRAMRLEQNTDASSPAASTHTVSDVQPESSEMDVSTGSHKDTTLLGFARLYSGVLKRAASIYCVLPKYNAALGPLHPKNAGHVIRTTVQALYTMMGRELEPVEEVRAGNVFAVRGLEEKVWRIATLCAPNSSSGLALGDLAEEDGKFLINLGGATRQVCCADIIFGQILNSR